MEQLMLQLCMISIFVVPAFILALHKSQYVVPYTICLWVVGPEVRRITDWLSGSYNDTSLVSIMPQLASLLLLLNIKPIREHVFNRVAVYLLGGAYLYASLIGVLFNQMAGIFAVINSVTPLLIFLYLITNQIDESQKNMYIRTYVSLAVICSVYGWIQYLILPPWDLFWLENASMTSIGRAEPMGFRVFSTLNSQVPFAIFLCTALVPMIVNRTWRRPFGIAGVLLVVSALSLTLVRGAWITLVVGIIACIMFSKSKNRWRSAIAVVIIAIGISQLMPYLPGAERITGRISTLGNIEDDYSYNDRMRMLTVALPTILKNPLGGGFGSIGRSTILSDKGSFAGMGSVDNGYLAVLTSFGLLGAVCFFASLFLMYKRIKIAAIGRKHDIFQVISRSMIIQLLVIFMFVGSLSGFNAVAFWFFSSLALTAGEQKV